jgi:hypothetical protein
MTKDSPKDRLRVSVEKLYQTATITFLPDSGVAGSMTISKNDLLLIIQELGKAHATMVGQNIPRFEHKKVDHVLNTRWYIEPEVIGGASGLSFYHNGFGPVGFLLPIHEAERLANTLAHQVEQAKREGRGGLL